MASSIEGFRQQFVSPGMRQDENIVQAAIAASGPAGVAATEEDSPEPSSAVNRYDGCARQTDLGTAKYHPGVTVPRWRSDFEAKERLMHVIFNKPWVMPGGNPYHTALEPERGLWDFEPPMQEAYAFLLARGRDRAQQQTVLDGASLAYASVVTLLVGLEVVAFRSLPDDKSGAGPGQYVLAVGCLAAVTYTLALCSRDLARYLRVNQDADWFYEEKFGRNRSMRWREGSQAST